MTAHPLAKGFLRSTLVGCAVLVLSGAGMTLLGGYLFHDSYSTYRMVQDVWSHGIEAQEANVEGKVTSRKFIFDEYKLDVQYRDASGVVHRAAVEMTSIIQGIDDKVEPSVKYDSNDFTRVSVSWLHDLSWGPWLWLLVGLAFVGGGIGLAVVSVRSAVNQLRDASSVAKGFRVVAANLLSMKQQENQGKPLPHFEVTCSLSADAKPITRAVKDGQPLVEGARVLVLVGEDGRAVVPRDDFYPLALPEHESQQLRMQFRRLSGPATTDENR